MTTRGLGFLRYAPILALAACVAKASPMAEKTAPAPRAAQTAAKLQTATFALG